MNLSSVWPGIIASVIGLILVIFFLNAFSSGGVESIEYSSAKFGNAMKMQSTALHLLNHENKQEFGKFTGTNLNDLLTDCGIENVKGVTENDVNASFGGATVPVKLETQSNTCENPTEIRHPIVLGVVKEDGSSQNVEKVVIR